MRVSIVETISPPITVIAIGVLTSEPSPKPIAIGSNPSAVVSDVINIGRRRAVPASMIASVRDLPCERRVSVLARAAGPSLGLGHVGPSGKEYKDGEER